MTTSDDTRVTNGLFDGRYRIVRRLGSGGMARVFLADDVDLHRQVAIKVLSDRYAEDAQFVERFAREARAAAGLNHPNIVQIYDRGEANGAYYIAMEHIDGETLKDVIVREGKLPPRRAIDIALQLLAALRFAHRRDVIHRDVKPHNIMVLRDGRVKVMDFGIARAGGSEMTEAGSIVGTAQYLAPEQARGMQVGPPADLYAVGVVLYEMLTGKVPFTGDSSVAIAMKHVQEPPTPPRRLEPSIPADLELVVLRALAKDPAKRYRTADEMGLDLDRVRKGIGLAATTALPPDEAAGYAPTRTVVAPPPRRLEDPDAVERRPSRTPAAPPPRRAWPWVLVLILALVVLGLGVVVWKGISGGGSGGGSTTATGPVLVTVRDVSNLTPQAALDQLKADGFAPVLQGEYSTQPPNTVLGTDPKAGTQAAKGSPVKVLVSRGQQQVAVPALKGEVWVNVRDTVTPNFKVALQRQASDTVPRGQVIDTNPAAGTQVPLGSPLTVILSSGPAQVQVPDVSGKSKDQAMQQLSDLGLNPTSTEQASDTVDAGTVITTNPPAGNSVAKGSAITVVVSSGSPPVTVPNLKGKSEVDAESALTDLGLKSNPQDVAVTDPAQDGVVQSQDPAVGTKLKKGDTVTLQIGRLGGG